MVSVSGVVTAAAFDGDPPPVEGATVTVVGSSSTATTDAQGNFSVMAPIGTVMFLTTAAGHWGEQLAQNVPSEGRNDLELQVRPDAFVAAIAAALQITHDASKGLVSVNFDAATAMGGEAAAISANREISFVFNADDEPVEGNTLIAGGDSEVTFMNTDVANSVIATAVNPSSQPCPLEFPTASYSVQAKVLTEIGVVCPP
jgi:hypothetical protein